MKFALILFLFQIVLPPNGVEKNQEIESLLSKMYNHTRQLSADKEAEKTARELLAKYPDDPLFYDIWASAEWLLIGRELNLKADEQRDVGEINGYGERAKKYRTTVEKGLSLTAGKNDEKNLFLRAALKFDQAKFSARYEGKFSGLKQADEQAAEGIKILRQLLGINHNFCSAYFFLGGNRFQLTSKTDPWSIKRVFVRNFSAIYNELYVLDKDVFDEKKAIEWLEIASNCGYPQPWLKKAWLENSFLLIDAYRQYAKGIGIENELSILNKEVLLLKQMTGALPQNSDLTQILNEKELRLKVLQNYFSRKTP